MDLNATGNNPENMEDIDEDDGECQSFPPSSTPENDRPSTITEVSLLLGGDSDQGKEEGSG